MPRRRLGRTELEVGVVGAGCWAIGGPDVNLGLPMGWGEVAESDALAGLSTSYESGVNLFDTADVYGHGRSERLVGQFVSGVERTSVVLTSKVGYFAGTAPHAYDKRHMRRQLEQSLENMQTDYLDIYFLHNSNFGADDKYLDDAIESMNEFRSEGLIGFVGMRGPHRYALDRVTEGKPKEDKQARFEFVFNLVRPEVLAIRDNLLSPSGRSEGIYRFAAEHDCGVLTNKPLSQGLLAGSYLNRPVRQFDLGDHRQRKAWFQPEALAIVNAGLAQVLDAIDSTDRSDLLALAVWACLERYEGSIALCGFANAEQAAMNANSARSMPDRESLELARRVMSEVQASLDRRTEVFLDEVGAE